MSPRLKANQINQLYASPERSDGMVGNSISSGEDSPLSKETSTRMRATQIDYRQRASEDGWDRAKSDGVDGNPFTFSETAFPTKILSTRITSLPWAYHWVLHQSVLGVRLVKTHALFQSQRKPIRTTSNDPVCKDTTPFTPSEDTSFSWVCGNNWIENAVVRQRQVLLARLKKFGVFVAFFQTHMENPGWSIELGFLRYPVIRVISKISEVPERRIRPLGIFTRAQSTNADYAQASWRCSSDEPLRSYVWWPMEKSKTIDWMSLPVPIRQEIAFPLNSQYSSKNRKPHYQSTGAMGVNTSQKNILRFSNITGSPLFITIPIVTCPRHHPPHFFQRKYLQSQLITINSPSMSQYNGQTQQERSE